LQYTSTEDGIMWIKTTRDGPLPTRLTNFSARIVADIAEDDGVEVKRNYEIEAELGGDTKRFMVPAAQFAAMTWPAEHLGARAIVSPGIGLRDHARAAIQELSGRQIKDRRIFAHSGWRNHDGSHVYLHREGAIGPRGVVSGVEVQLPDNLQPMQLPPPPAGERLKASIRASLEILNIGPPSICFPLYAAVWRSVLGTTDFSIFVSGQTGVGKTAVAALLEQHFGAGFHARNLPGSWSSTGNANEGLAFGTL
jgi:hypothetical protein